jgi:hypothetical protein
MWENDKQTFISSTRSTVYEIGGADSKLQDLNLIDSSSINYKFVNDQIIHDPIIMNIQQHQTTTPVSVESQVYQLTSMLNSTITKVRLTSPSSISSEQQLVNLQIEHECQTFDQIPPSKRKSITGLPLLSKIADLNNIDIRTAIDNFRASQKHTTDIIVRTELIKLDMLHRINNATDIIEFDEIRQTIKNLDLTSLEKLN